MSLKDDLPFPVQTVKVGTHSRAAVHYAVTTPIWWRLPGGRDVERYPGDALCSPMKLRGRRARSVDAEVTCAGCIDAAIRLARAEKVSDQ